ncbi:MAG: TRAP transporter small permease subunit [Pseudomonadota bacterium]
MSRLEPIQRGFAALTAAIDKGVTALTAVLLALVVGANGLEILLRGLFSHSFRWLYESNLLVANWLYFLGMCLVYYRNKDITLDFVLMVLKGRARAGYLIAINLVGIATFATIAWFAVVLMALQLPFRTPGYRIPNPLFTLPVGLSALFIALILISQSLEIWRRGELPRGGHGMGARPE